MGLDIIAYEHVELKATGLQELTAGDLADELFEQGVDALLIGDAKEYTWRSAPMLAPAAGYVNLYIAGGETYTFRGGSYSGHGLFRRWLCDMAGIATPEQQWSDPDKFAPLPFHELVNFSDCEGVIGSAACVELAADFAAYQERAELASPLTMGGAQFLRIYNCWRKAFELTQCDGAILFA